VPLAGLTLPRERSAPLRAQVPAAASETFMGTDDDGQPALERERIVLSWFVEGGELDEERTAYIDGVVELERAVENAWTPAPVEDYDRPTADLVLIVRDSREGVSWLRATANLGAAP